jgi:toxin YoeB
LISNHPKIGVPTNQEKIRIKMVRDYLIFYEETETEIHVLTIWQSHQDPQGLKGILK